MQKNPFGYDSSKDFNFGVFDIDEKVIESNVHNPRVNPYFFKQQIDQEKMFEMIKKREKYVAEEMRE